MKQNYFKIGLYIAGTIAVIAIIYMVFRAFKRGQNAVAGIGDAIQDNNTNTAIAQQTGIPKIQVDEARRIAKDIAVELESYKDLTAWSKIKSVVTDSEIMDIMNQVKSAGQMRAVGYIYKAEMTNNHDLKADLKNELSNSLFLKVPFIQSLNQ